MDIFLCEGAMNYGESVYKHTDVYALFSALNIRSKNELKVKEGSPFTINIYQIPFTFMLKRLSSFDEFAYAYAKRKTPPEVLPKLFRLGVLRVYWTQSMLRSRLMNCANCIDGWLYKDLFSDTVPAYQAFSPMENILLVVRW